MVTEICTKKDVHVFSKVNVRFELLKEGVQRTSDGYK